MPTTFDWKSFSQLAREQEEAFNTHGGFLIPDHLTVEDLKRAYIVEVGLDASGKVTVHNTGKPFLQPAAIAEEEAG